MAESILFIGVETNQSNDSWRKENRRICRDKIYGNRHFYEAKVNDRSHLDFKSKSLRNGFRALAVSPNPILWINHHGHGDPQCEYPNSKINEPKNMARLIRENARDLVFRDTLQIVQFSCYASQYHTRLLALELRSFGFKNFNIWGSAGRLSSKYDGRNHFFVCIPNTRNLKVLDHFWKKVDVADGGGYWYADCISVNRRGEIQEFKSKCTRMGREERKNFGNMRAERLQSDLRQQRLQRQRLLQQRLQQQQNQRRQRQRRR